MCAMKRQRAEHDTKLAKETQNEAGQFEERKSHLFIEASVAQAPLKASSWSAINCIRNMIVRFFYDRKIKYNAAEYNTRIRNGVSPEELESTAKEAVESRNEALKAARDQQGITMQCFSVIIKKEGKVYNDLAEKYSQELYSKSFSTLNEEERSTINCAIIKASGHSNPLVNKVSKIIGAFGIAILFLLVAAIIWGVVTSNNPLLTVAKNTWESMESLVVGYIFEVLASVTLKAVLVAVGASDRVTAGVTLVGGIAAGLLIAYFAPSILTTLVDLTMKTVSPLEYNGSYIYSL